MARILPALLLILLVALGCTPQQQTKAQSEKKASSDGFLAYENTDYGISASYPNNWAPTEQVEGIIVAFLSPTEGPADQFQENLNLVMNDLSDQDLDLEEYTSISLASLKKVYPEMVIEESGSATLGGTAAHKIVYTASAGNLNLKIMQVWTIKNEISYVWTYTAKEDAYAAYLGITQKMLDSFKITRNILQEVPQEKPAEEQNADKDNGAQVSASSKDANPAFVGSWRVYSERLFYDIGGAGSMAVPLTRPLEISKEGTWAFGDSKGTWEVSEITDADWTRWGISSYGPAKKMTLDGWNEATADGPIEESSGRVDFIWVIYHVEPPQVQNAGTVWLKFGH